MRLIRRCRMTCMDRLKSVLQALALGVLVLHIDGPVRAQSSGAERGLGTTGHLKIETPGALTPAEANEVYDGIADDLAGFYAMSREPAAIAFRKWRRYNSAPYLSATHGNRYVNNYGNRLSAGYDRMTSGFRMPAGAVLVKNSFTVTADGEVFGAAMFIMEKLPAGRRPETGDWRYVMIMPDGSYEGDSEGDNAAAVGYCHDCHAAVARTDFLFYIPKAYRAVAGD